MLPYDLTDLLSHGNYGIQGSHGVLKDHRDLLTADFSHFGLRFFQNIIALKENLTLLDLAAGG